MGNKFGNNVKFTETVMYKGELRIIGTIRKEFKTSSPILGYVALIEKTKVQKAYTEEQIKSLLRSGIVKFVNARLNNGKVEITECSINSLPIFDKTLKLNSSTLIILGKIYLVGKKLTDKTFFKYRVLLVGKGDADLTEQELIKLVEDNSLTIANAKIVTRNNKRFISAIKDEFTTILLQKETNETETKEPVTKKKANIKNKNTRLWRETKYRERVTKWFEHILLKSCKARKVKYISISDVQTQDEKSTSTLNLKRVIKVFTTEILPDYVKTEEDKQLLKEILHTFKISPVLYSSRAKDKNTNTDETLLALVALAQFILNDEEKFSVLSSLNKKDCHDAIYNELKQKKLATKKYEKFIQVRRKKAGKRDRIDLNNYKTYSGFSSEMLKFDNEYSCNQIGFTLSKNNAGTKIITEFGNRFKLKYIGDLVTSYNKYMEISNCLGDVLILAQIEKTLELETTTWSKDEAIARVEIMLAILSIYRPDIVKVYLENNIERLKEYGWEDVESIPLNNMDLNNKTDYKLHDDVKVYYASGFNVFLSDIQFRNTNSYMADSFDKLDRYKDAKYINYRTLPLYEYCEHPMLHNDLGAVVSLITSERVTQEVIERVIGGLRTL